MYRLTPFSFRWTVPLSRPTMATTGKGGRGKFSPNTSCVTAGREDLDSHPRHTSVRAKECTSQLAFMHGTRFRTYFSINITIDIVILWLGKTCTGTSRRSILRDTSTSASVAHPDYFHSNPISRFHALRIRILLYEVQELSYILGCPRWRRIFESEVVPYL